MRIYRKQLFLAVAIYASMSLVILTVYMAFNSDGRQDMMMPFAISLYPAMATLSPKKLQNPRLPTQSIALISMLLISLVTVAANRLFPQRVENPWDGIGGFGIAIAVLLPAYLVYTWVAKPLSPNKENE